MSTPALPQGRREEEIVRNDPPVDRHPSYSFPLRGKEIGPVRGYPELLNMVGG